MTCACNFLCTRLRAVADQLELGDKEQNEVSGNKIAAKAEDAA